MSVEISHQKKTLAISPFFTLPNTGIFLTIWFCTYQPSAHSSSPHMDDFHKIKAKICKTLLTINILFNNILLTIDQFKMFLDIKKGRDSTHTENEYKKWNCDIFGGCLQFLHEKNKYEITKCLQNYLFVHYLNKFCCKRFIHWFCRHPPPSLKNRCIFTQEIEY